MRPSFGRSTSEDGKGAASQPTPASGNRYTALVDTFLKRQQAALVRRSHSFHNMSELVAAAATETEAEAEADMANQAAAPSRRDSGASRESMLRMARSTQEALERVQASREAQRKRDAARLDTRWVAMTACTKAVSRCEVGCVDSVCRYTIHESKGQPQPQLFGSLGVGMDGIAARTPALRSVSSRAGTSCALVKLPSHGVLGPVVWGMRVACDANVCVRGCCSARNAKGSAREKVVCAQPHKRHQGRRVFP